MPTMNALAKQNFSSRSEQKCMRLPTYTVAGKHVGGGANGKRTKQPPQHAVKKQQTSTETRAKELKLFADFKPAATP